MSVSKHALRIALASDWYLPRLGGIELQLAGLATALRRLGHDAHVVTSTPPNGIDDHTVHRLRLVRIAWAGVTLSPRLVSGLRRDLAAMRPDVVHAHVSVVSPVGYASVLAARALGIPAVVTFHSVLLASARWLGWMDRLIAWRKWPIVVTAVSEHVAAQLRRAVPGLPVTVLPNGTDVAAWAGTRNGTRADGRVVSAMRLHRKKRPLELVRAFASAAAGRPTATLTIFGDGPQRGLLEREIARRDLEGRVRLAGQVRQEELRERYAQASFFVLPTRREAFGIAALEARCAGLPVVAMRGSGVTEFVEHGIDALLANDDAELAQHIERLLVDDTLRATLTASNDGLTRFDWAAVAANHEACYRGAMEVRAARRIWS